MGWKGWVCVSGFVNARFEGRQRSIYLAQHRHEDEGDVVEVELVNRAVLRLQLQW